MIIQAFQSGRRENIQGDVGRAEVTECRVVGEKVLAPQMWLDGLCSWQPRTHSSWQRLCCPSHQYWFTSGSPCTLYDGLQEYPDVLVCKLLSIWACVSPIQVSISRPLGNKMYLRVPDPIYSSTGHIRRKDGTWHLCRLWPMLKLQSIASWLSALLSLGGVCTNGEYSTHDHWSHMAQKESHTFERGA